MMTRILPAWKRRPESVVYNGATISTIEMGEGRKNLGVWRPEGPGPKAGGAYFSKVDSMLLQLSSNTCPPYSSCQRSFLLGLKPV